MHAHTNDKQHSTQFVHNKGIKQHLSLQTVGYRKILPKPDNYTVMLTIANAWSVTSTTPPEPEECSPSSGAQIGPLSSKQGIVPALLDFIPRRQYERQSMSQLLYSNSRVVKR